MPSIVSEASLYLVPNERWVLACLQNEKMQQFPVCTKQTDKLGRAWRELTRAEK